MTRSIKSRYDIIASGAHVLAFLLDTFVSTERCIYVSRLLSGRVVVAKAQEVLEEDLENSLLSSNQTSDYRRVSQFRFQNLGTKQPAFQLLTPHMFVGLLSVMRESPS